MSEEIQFFAAAPRGVAPILSEELIALGCRNIRETVAGVGFSGGLEDGYRALLWSRTASRVVLLLASVPITDENSCYDAARSVVWHKHMSRGGTFCVDVTQAGTQIPNTHYAALKIKDAVADQFREKFRVRPDVRVDRPMVKIAAHVEAGHLDLGIDLSGEGMHRRGYRAEGVAAPLKENLAAAILLRARWPEMAKEQGSLCDPMCGSGTFLIEAALMASDCAPGLFRDWFGFMGWKGHDPALWDRLVAAARSRAVAGKSALPPISGCDSDARAVMAAQKNVFRAGFSDLIEVKKRDLSRFAPPENKKSRTGLLISNPPYGERLGTVTELVGLYRKLGELLKEKFSGFSAAVFTGNPELARQIGIWAKSTHDFYNGPIACKLLRFDVQSEHFFTPRDFEPEKIADPEPKPEVAGPSERVKTAPERPGDRQYRPRARTGQARVERPDARRRYGQEGAVPGRPRPDRPYARPAGEKVARPGAPAGAGKDFKRPYKKRTEEGGEKSASRDRQRPGTRDDRPYKGAARAKDFGPGAPAGAGKDFKRPYKKRSDEGGEKSASRDRQRPGTRDDRPYKGAARAKDFGPGAPAGAGKDFKRPYKKRSDEGGGAGASRDRQGPGKGEGRPHAGLSGEKARDGAKKPWTKKPGAEKRSGFSKPGGAAGKGRKPGGKFPKPKGQK